ncbi:hypothetical protein D3C71_1592710 [compost metagenome]
MPEKARLLLGADVVGDHRHQLVLQGFGGVNLEEADAREIGIFLQDGKQPLHAQADAVRQFGFLQVVGQARLIDGLAQALGEHAHQFVVGRLLAGEVLIENWLGHAGPADDVADPGVLKSAFRELRGRDLQKL